MGIRRWLLAGCLLLHGLPVIAADWDYTVRPGESLWQIARRFCGSHRHVGMLATHNALADPGQVRPGVVLRIPVSCLVMEPASAALVEAAADVRLLRAGGAVPAIPGTEVRMGDTLVTAAGFAVVEFADGSRLTVRPGTEIDFVLLSAHGSSGMVDTHTRLRRGRVQHDVEGSRGSGHRHRITTPVGAAAVRGTEYRVELPGSAADPDPAVARATVATTRGEVAFLQAASPALAVPAGTGVVATGAGSRKEDLLPAPRLADALRKGQGRQVEWSAVAGAVAYRVTLSGAGTLLGEAVVPETAWEVDAEPGHYTLSVRAIAASDLEGLDALAPLEVVPAGPSGLGLDKTSDAGVHLRWHAGDTDAGPFTARIEGQGQALEVAAAADGAEVALPPGRYRWQVRGRDSDWSDPAAFVVSPQAVAGLSGQRQKPKLPLDLQWQPPSHAVAGYRVEVLVRGQRVVDRETAEPGLSLPELAGRHCSPCEVRVTTRAEGLQSDYTALEYRDPPGHPWPIYVALALILIAL